MHHPARRLAPAALLCVLVAAFAVTARPAAGDETARKVVLLAGVPDGHPPTTHEYAKSAYLLKHCLDTSPNLKGVKSEVHLDGWPKDAATLDDADTIVFITSGSDHVESNHPLFVGDRMSVVGNQMKRGCGIVTIHYSTFAPVRLGDKITEWAGGYFDYQSGPPEGKWYSKIQHWKGPTRLGAPEHPISRGVKPPEVQEEFYYRMRFREPADPRLTPILLTRPPNEEQEFPVGWAVQRTEDEGGGRGFGFTGGHYYANYWDADFRRLLLNAIAWTAGAEVPEEGVKDNLDPAPAKVLILTGHHHPGHDWRGLTAALRIALERDPRLTVEVSENIEDLATKPLGEYAVLVMNYNNWDRPGLSEEAKKKFTEYLSNGGGLAVIHFANGAFHYSLPDNAASDWPEYRKIVRRVWDHTDKTGRRSSHDPFGPFRVDVTAAKHPITEGLAPFETVDELYYDQAGDEPIEPLATARSKDTDRDEPMAWAYEYEKGRVFQTVLGHAPRSVLAAANLVRRGFAWAAGRPPLGFDPAAGASAEDLAGKELLVPVPAENKEGK